MRAILSVALITFRESIRNRIVLGILLLAVGFIASMFMFLLVFLIPTHLLENPLRHARGIRPDDRYY